MGGFQPKLKLKISFEDKAFLKEKAKKVKKNIREHFTIKDFAIIKVLGEGAFAKVLLVRQRDNGKLYAMKVIHKNKIMKTMDEENPGLSSEELAYRNLYRVKQIISERNIFSQLNEEPNPFIV